MIDPDDEYLSYDFSFLGHPVVAAVEPALGPEEAGEEYQQLEEYVLEGNPSDPPFQEIAPLREEFEPFEENGLEQRTEEQLRQLAVDSLRKNFTECAKALSMCSQQLKQLDSIKAEKDNLATQIAALNEYNGTVLAELHESRRLSAFEQVERRRAEERQRELTDELITLKGLYDDNKKKAATSDLFKLKFHQLKEICDKFQEQRQDWAKKFQECVRVIKMKNNEITMIRESREQLREAKQTTAQEVRNTHKLKSDLVRLVKTLAKVELPTSAQIVLQRMRREAGIQDKSPIGRQPIKQDVAEEEEQSGEEEESDDDLCAELEGMLQNDQPLASMLMTSRRPHRQTSQKTTTIQPVVVKRPSCPLNNVPKKKERPIRSNKNKSLLWQMHEKNPVHVQEEMELVESPQIAQSSTSISSIESQAPPSSQKSHEAILLSVPLPPPHNLPKLKRKKPARGVPAPKAPLDDCLFKIPEETAKKGSILLKEIFEDSESRSSVLKQSVIRQTRSLSRREGSLPPSTPLLPSSRKTKIEEISLFSPRSPKPVPPPLSPLTSPLGRVTRSRTSSVCVQPATPIKPAPTPSKPKKTPNEQPFPSKKTQDILASVHKLEAELYPRIKPLAGQNLSTDEIADFGQEATSFEFSELEPLPAKLDELSIDETAESRQGPAPKKAKFEILDESTSIPEPLPEKTMVLGKKRAQNRVQKMEIEVSDTVIQVQEPVLAKNRAQKTVKMEIQESNTVISVPEPLFAKLDDISIRENNLERTIIHVKQPYPSEFDVLPAKKVQKAVKPVTQIQESLPAQNRVKSIQKTVKTEILESSTVLESLPLENNSFSAQNRVQMAVKTEIQLADTIIPVKEPLPAENLVQKTVETESALVITMPKRQPKEKPFPSIKTQDILVSVQKFGAELYPGIEPLLQTDEIADFGQEQASFEFSELDRLPAKLDELSVDEKAEIRQGPALKKARLEKPDESTVIHEPLSEKSNTQFKKRVQNRVKTSTIPVGEVPKRAQKTVKTEIYKSNTVIPVQEPLLDHLNALWIDENAGLEIAEESTVFIAEKPLPGKADTPVSKKVQNRVRKTVKTKIQVPDTVIPVQEPLSIGGEIQESSTVTPVFRKPPAPKITPRAPVNRPKTKIKSETKEVEIIAPRRQRQRGHEEPVNFKQKKALPEALLATMLEMPDLDTVRTRFSEQDMAAIQAISPQRFGEVMAQVAIRLQTGNMWTLLMANFRKKSTDRLSNKTEDTLIFLANELSTGSGNLWAPFIRSLWRFLVFQPVHDISLCCKIVRFICAGLNVEVQLEETGTAEIGAEAANFVRNLINFVAFSYPNFLGQTLIYVLHLLPAEYVQFLCEEPDLRKILVLYTDDVTRTILLWSWNSFCPEDELVLSRQNEITIDDVLFYMPEVDEEMEFTDSGALQVSTIAARSLKLRALFQSSQAGLSSLQAELESAEMLLRTAAEQYVNRSSERDPAAGSLFQLGGNVTLSEAREICLRLHFLASLLPMFIRMGRSRTRDIYVRRIEAIASQAYTVESAIKNESRHLNAQKEMLLKSFDNFLSLIRLCTRKKRA